MPEAREPAAAAVLQLLGAEHQHDVVHAGRRREARVAEGVGAGGAVVLDPRDRPAVEPERVAERRRPTSRRPAPGMYVPRYAASISAGSMPASSYAANAASQMSSSYPRS